jgi:hypothetical protein
LLPDLYVARLSAQMVLLVVDGFDLRMLLLAAAIILHAAAAAQLDSKLQLLLIVLHGAAHYRHARISVAFASGVFV